MVAKLSETDKNLLKEIGIISQNDFGRERFKDCIVFPVINELGQITEIYGRAIKPEKGKHFYLPGARQGSRAGGDEVTGGNLSRVVGRGIFNPKALEHKEIFLCESIIDALSIMSLGYMNVTASFGINGFTDEMLNLLKAKGIQKVYICYDNDRQAGKAIALLVEKLKAIGIEVYRILFEQVRSSASAEAEVLAASNGRRVKDANDFLCKTTDLEEAQKTFEALTKESRALWEKPKQADKYEESWSVKKSEGNPGGFRGQGGCAGIQITQQVWWFIREKTNKDV